MALVEAFFALDYKALNLNFYVENYNSETFFDGGGTGFDVLHVYSTLDTALSHYGSDFTLNSGGFVDGGSVDTIAEWFFDALTDQWIPLYGISGGNTPIQSFFDVAQTPSNADDLALFKTILSGNDKAYLSAFDDSMSGFGGNDKMYGYAGNDILIGSNGKDSLFGGTGNDTLKGGNGDDIIRGGKGRDKEFGGDGEDVFRFRTGDDVSIIKDFDAKGAVHDVIDLSGLASVTSWLDLKNHHMERVDGNVEIDAGGGDLIVIRDVTLASLDKGDFLF